VQQGWPVSRITVVNDSPEFLELVKDVLEDERYQTTTIDLDTPDTLERITASQPDLLIIDLRVGRSGHEGWIVARQIREQPGLDRLPILICSGDIQALAEIESVVADTPLAETLTKPFHIDQLTDAVERLLVESRGP
jgi:CheY-like chemotaxis protein